MRLFLHNYRARAVNNGCKDVPIFILLLPKSPPRRPPLIAAAPVAKRANVPTIEYGK